MPDDPQEVTNEILDTREMIALNRLETIGRVSTGLIHHLNNTLGVLYGYLEMALEDCPSSSPRREQLRMVDESADKIRDAVNRFHLLCSRYVEKTDRFDLVAESRGLLRLSELFFPSSFLVEAEWPDRPLWVRGRADRWRQALLNVLLNSRDAMGDGGTVRIEVTEREGLVFLEVRDSGSLLESRGESLFSRKAQQCILEEAGGGMEVVDSPLGGVAVRFRLPLDSCPR